MADIIKFPSKQPNGRRLVDSVPQRKGAKRAAPKGHRKGKPALPPADIAVLEGLLERVKDGRATGFAFVEVLPDGGVATAWRGCPQGLYHHLHSGASLLHQRLAGD